MSFRRGVKGRYGRWAAVSVSCAVMGVPIALSVPAAAASPADTELTAIAPALEQDERGKLPKLDRSEVVADFFDKGHDQRAVIEDGFVRIYDHPDWGGSKLRELKIEVTGATNDSRGSFIDDVRPFAKSSELDKVQLSGDAKGLYIAGNMGGQPVLISTNEDLSDFQSPRHLGRGTYDRKERWITDWWNWGRMIGWDTERPFATATAIGNVDGKRMIAVATSTAHFFDKNDVWIDDEVPASYQKQESPRVQIYDADDIWATNPIYTIDLPTTDNGSMPSSLAIGDLGNGESSLAVGMNGGAINQLHVISLKDGKTETRWGDWMDVKPEEARDGANSPTTLAYGRWKGEQVLAVGTNSGKVSIMKASGNGSGKSSPITTQPALKNAPVAGINFFTDSSGKERLMVGRVGGGEHTVLEDTGRSGDEGTELRASAVGQAIRDGRAEINDKTDGDTARTIYPGYIAPRLTVENRKGNDIDVRMSPAKPGDEYLGCWRNAAVADGVPFPEEPHTVRPGEPQSFTSVASMLSDQGRCAADGGTYTYLQVQDSQKHSEPTTFKLQVDNGSLTVAWDNSGSGTKLTAQRDENDPHAYRLVVEDEFSAVKAVTAPQATGHRLVNQPHNNDPGLTVYRVDVTGAQWRIEGAEHLDNAVIPPLKVQGTTNGMTWTDVGDLIPASAPTLKDGLLTMGSASFYWENAKGPQYTKLRVSAGDQRGSSIDLGSLPKPPVLTDAPLAPTAATNAVPRPNGVDQVPLVITPYIAPGTPALEERAYDYLFFRDTATSSLITGLHRTGEDFDQYMSITPVRGQYQPTGTENSNYRFYLSTANHANTANQAVRAYINLNGNEWRNNNQTKDMKVTASRTALTASSADNSGYAVGGIAIKGCPEDTCRLVAPSSTQPALYQARSKGGPPLIGVALNPHARTDNASLPLRTVTGDKTDFDRHLTPLETQSTRAILRDAAQIFTPNEMIRTRITTHGDLVTAILPSMPSGQ